MYSLRWQTCLFRNVPFSNHWGQHTSVQPVRPSLVNRTTFTISTYTIGTYLFCTRIVSPSVIFPHAGNRLLICVIPFSINLLWSYTRTCTGLINICPNSLSFYLSIPGNPAIFCHQPFVGQLWKPQPMFLMLTRGL